MYNRYASRCNEYCRTEPKHEPLRTGGREPPPPPPPQRPVQDRQKSGPLSFLNLNFLQKGAGGILPKDMDLGDILLYLVLFLLYLENNDEECLIILLVLLFMK